MYTITDVIVVAVAAAGITLVLAAWFYERELDNHHCDCDEFDIDNRIPIGDPAQQKTPGIPDEYLRPLAYAGLFDGGAGLDIKFPWTPEIGDQS